MKKGGVLDLNRIASIWPKFALNWPSCSGEKDCSNSATYFHYFELSPLGKGGTVHLNKLEFTSSKNDLCQVRLKFAQWFWRRRILDFVIAISQFRNFLPLEKGGPFIWTNLTSLNSKDDLCSIGLKLARWFGRRLYKFVNEFSQFRYYLLLEKGGSFIWTNLNPIHSRALCTMFG